VTELRKLFPTLGSCHERLARRPLPKARKLVCNSTLAGAGATYSEAVERLLEAVAKSASSPTDHRQIGDKFSAAERAVEAGGENPCEATGGE